MKSALPVNSIRLISGDTFGMNLLRTSPEKNAPKIPSSPTASDIAAERNITASVKMNCITESEYFRRNQCANRGMAKINPAQNAVSLTVNSNQKLQPAPPLKLFTTAAMTSRARKSDTIDPPTLNVELTCRVSPYRPTIG